jgi:peptidoglycan/LPS O-acetylase OafA/YrhL
MPVARKQGLRLPSGDKMAKSSHKEIFSSLESCRGLAAFSVLLYHVPWSTIVTDMPIIRHMYTMVDFFFVLSGFVIFHTYGDRIYSAASVARFLWLRIGRLYPLHIFMLSVFLFIELSKYATDLLFKLKANNPAFIENDLGSFFVNLLLLQSWGISGYHTWNFASWSISVEFYLYVIVAILILAFSNARGLFGLFISPAIATVAAYLLTREGNSHSQYVDVLRGFTGFFIGVFIYEIRRKLLELPVVSNLNRHILNMLAISAVLAILALLNRDGFVPYVWAYPFFAILVLCISILPDEYGINNVLKAKPLLWLGQISYSIYMIHHALLWVFKQFARLALHAPEISVHGQRMFSLPFWTAHLLLVIAVSSTLGCAYLTYRYIEERYRLKSRAIADAYFSHATSDHLTRQSAA